MLPGVIVIIFLLLAACVRIFMWMREEREAHERHEEWKRKNQDLELQQLVSEGIPKDYLRNPEVAIRKWGEPALEAWLGITEPKYRTASNYPPDWLWRRFFILLRDENKCCLCASDGEKAYRKKRRRMENKPRWNPLGGLDVHHITPVTKAEITLLTI